MLPTTVFDTGQLEPRERFDFWRHTMATVVSPLDLTSHTTSDYHGRMRLIALEDVYVFPITMQAFQSRRTPGLIRRSDPENYHLAVVFPGASPLAVTQGAGQDVTGPGQLYMVDSSRPFTVGSTEQDKHAKGLCVEIPRSRLNLPGSTPVGGLLGRSMSATRGFGGLLAQHLSHLCAQHHTYRPSDIPQLAALVSDLITGLINQTLDAGPPPDPDRAEHTLLLAIKLFIEQNLADSGMKPTAIAAHHHISTRHLHRLFQQHGTTPAAHIRRRRLERAHRDLTDPAHARTPIHAVAARWGFTSHAHFTRTYTQHYGSSPTHTRLVLDQERQAS
ncbi:helix-turn-helix domain-containing protein [Streptomyces sp. JH002]|uniref:helix-turn-helix domain-containing protein n=1 Tax=Streptomyces sp. JH002 TaxID=2763259 RepID=UPI003D803DF8